jgi:hypothetical protein
MYHRIASFWHCLALISLVASGCKTADEAAMDVESVTAAIAEPVAGKSDQPTPDTKSTEGESKPAAPIIAAQFSPPFPERVELFEPPKRAQSTGRREDESGDTVELKGFINVDQPRVVLSIDGTIAPIAEGGEKYGVQVISIQPPSVVLQRGRSRWTATLE